MEKQKRHIGDRYDGRRVKGLDSAHVIIPYFYPNRCDNEVFLRETIDVSKLLEYVKEKNLVETEAKTTIFHVITTAVAKTIKHRPLLNRFLSGKRFYDRDEVSLSFVAKKRFEDHSEEALMILHTDGDTTLSTVTKRIVGDVHVVREGKNNGADDVMDFFAKFPRCIMMLAVWALNIMNFYGIVPKGIIDVDPNFTTVLMTNMGSIKCGAPYHHLNNWGTNSVFISIGEIHKEKILDRDGGERIIDAMDLGFTLDERIADGFYFAKSIKLLKHLLANPELLERPIKEDVEYEY